MPQSRLTEALNDRKSSISPAYFTASKKCPMCGTENAKEAQTCKFCGYIFENFDSAQIDPSAKSVPSALNQVPPIQKEASAMNTGAEGSFPAFGTSSPDPISTIESGSPAFVVSKSLLSSILPSIAYLVFILVFTTSAGISIYSLAVFLFFIAIAIVPVLFSPRRFEFYEDQVKVHKTVGGDTLIPYSDLTHSFIQRGNRPQIILSSISRRMRALVVPGNPTNKEMGMDLNQFLEKKVRKPRSPGPAAKNDTPSGPDTSQNGYSPNTDAAEGFDSN